MQEPLTRFIVFIAILFLMAVLQALFPRRKLRLSYRRWSANFGLVAVNALLLRLLLPAGAIGAALWAVQADFGLLHWLHIEDNWGALALVVVSVLLLDLLIYAQHVLFHAVPVLWRLHKV
ncbi:MAG: sterol desaturase family protein, partial [Mariprofundaceae bacterium]|nr:sterol desaturase family protein [Mariprofundaceae bacterium]